jgi:hypothetical protein
MKKIVLLFGMGLCVFFAKGQNVDSAVVVKPEEEVVTTNDTASQKVLGDSPEVDKKGDTTRIRLGKKGITIVEKNGKTTVQIDKLDGEKDIENEEEIEENEDDFAKSDWDNNNFPKFNPFRGKNNKKHFEGHWGGLDIVLNNFMTSDFSLNLPQKDRYIELNTGKSIGVRLNLLEYCIPFSSEQGLTTGLGFEFNSYYFDSDTNNIKKENGEIRPKIKPYSAGSYSKNKIKDTYLNIPLTYEIQFPLGNSKRPLYFSIGVIGGLKLGSTSKEYYQMNGDDKEEISSGDFFMSPIRLGYQARLGFRRIHLVATYYDTPLFRSGRGPEVHPFDVGLMVLNW